MGKLITMSTTNHPVFDMTDSQFELVYNCLSLTLASMMASTIFFWLRVSSIHENYKSALVLTGLPFNDAYRYMDWLLTVPLLLIEIVFVMKLDEDTYSAKAKTLGVGSALMIISGYYGELTVTGDLTPRWGC